MIILKALKFARERHEGQIRKYTKEPYIFHPISVSFILCTVTQDRGIIAAGLLHDILEDTKTTADELLNLFGERVTGFVLDVTDVSRPHDGNRKIRKEIDREHLASADPDSKTIKLADLLDNTWSVIKHDPRGFGPLYIGEKERLLPYLIEGNNELYQRVERIIKDYRESK